MSEPNSIAPSPRVSFERERGVYAIQVMRDVAHAVISVGDDAQRTNRILQVFRILGEANVPVFLFKLHRTVVTLACIGTDLARAQDALDAAGFKTKVRRDLAIVSVRATSMREMFGVMSDIADALYAANARLYETGDSHDSFQCLIESARVPDAVRAFRQTFSLSEDAVQETSAQEEDGA